MNAPANDEQRQKLNSIGFCWAAEKGRRKRPVPSETSHADATAIHDESGHKTTKKSPVKRLGSIPCHRSGAGARIIWDGIYGSVEQEISADWDLGSRGEMSGKFPLGERSGLDGANTNRLSPHNVIHSDGLEDVFTSCEQ